MKAKKREREAALNKKTTEQLQYEEEQRRIQEDRFEELRRANAEKEQNKESPGPEKQDAGAGSGGKKSKKKKNRKSPGGGPSPETADRDPDNKWSKVNEKQEVPEQVAHARHEHHRQPQRQQERSTADHLEDQFYSFAREKDNQFFGNGHVGPKYSTPEFGRDKNADYTDEDDVEDFPGHDYDEAERIPPVESPHDASPANNQGPKASIDGLEHFIQ